MGYRILAVEDDAFLRSAYMIKLTKAGFTVQVANDGIQALETLKTFIPDLILLDLVMPRKDGFSTLEDIKKQENLRNIPVIVASNLGQQDEVDRVTALGATSFIIKSDLSLADLIIKINDILEKK